MNANILKQEPARRPLSREGEAVNLRETKIGNLELILTGEGWEWLDGVYAEDGPEAYVAVFDVLEASGHIGNGWGVVSPSPESDPPASAPHTAIIGRIPGDDEDSVYVYPTADEGEALELFEEDIWRELGNAERRARCEADGEPLVFHTATLQSDTEIRLAFLSP